MWFEVKVLDDDDCLVGFNLICVSLDVMCKYLWMVDSFVFDLGGCFKFGVYFEDEDVFWWMCEGVLGCLCCIEVEIMDFFDDIVYFVYDFEDVIVNGYVDVVQFVDLFVYDVLFGCIQQWVGYDFICDEFVDVLYCFVLQQMWFVLFDCFCQDFVWLKNFISDFIGCFVCVVVLVICEVYGMSVLVCYNVYVIVLWVVEVEIVVFKGIMGQVIVMIEVCKGVYKEQWWVFKCFVDVFWLIDVLWLVGLDVFELVFVVDFVVVQDDVEWVCVVVDQIVSLIDQSVIDWYN